MKWKRLPAWQQVLQVAMGNVSGAKGGHDAWEQLNGEEKAAVMDFLAEYCGENASSALADTCALPNRAGCRRDWGTSWALSGPWRSGLS